jgi:hypothetical protein
MNFDSRHRAWSFDSLQILWLIGRRQHPQTDVNHAMLHRIHDQSKQRIHLITGKVARIGECAGNLVFPSLGKPFAGARLYKLLHFGRHACHIGRTAKNHRVGLIEIVDSSDSFFDRPEMGLYSANRGSTPDARIGPGVWYDRIRYDR